MESVSSDTNTSVFSSPDTVELANTRKFETSISVSSLAEKFERSGDFSKIEQKSYTESPMERSHSLTENNSESNCVLSEIDDSPPQPLEKTNIEFIACFKEPNDSSENFKSLIMNQAAVVNGNDNNGQSIQAPSDCSTDNEAKHVGDSTDSKPSVAIIDEPVCRNGFEVYTDSQTSKVIEEKVNYFINKFPNASQNAASAVITEDDSDGNTGGEDKVSRKLSLKDLEQSFINALIMVNSECEAMKTADSLPVPSIEITEASDREDASSDEAEEKKPKRDVVETEVKTPAENEEKDNDERKTNEDASTSTASPDELKSKTEASAECKAFFYISSSDLPEERPQESVRNCDDEELSSESADDSPASTSIPESNETRSSCLRSKTRHGITFLVAFVVAIFGCILYGFAHQGKVPDYCEYLGLVIAILSGMVGAFSCFCYSCLEIFPGPSRAGYERMPDARYIPSLQHQNETAHARNLDDSWSSEKERAFRRQNGMSSTSTSAASSKSGPGEYIVIKKGEQRDLVDKTEKMRKGFMEFIDAFNAFMSKMEAIDKLVEMESGFGI